MKPKIKTEWVECYVLFYDDLDRADIGWYKIESPVRNSEGPILDQLLRLSGEVDAPTVVVTEESPLFSWAANIVGGDVIECSFDLSDLMAIASLAEDLDPWQSFIEWSREDWAHEVFDHNTNSGYWEWVRHQIKFKDKE